MSEKQAGTRSGGEGAEDAGAATAGAHKPFNAEAEGLRGAFDLERLYHAETTLDLWRARYDLASMQIDRWAREVRERRAASRGEDPARVIADLKHTVLCLRHDVKTQTSLAEAMRATADEMEREAKRATDLLNFVRAELRPTFPLTSDETLVGHVREIVRRFTECAALLAPACEPIPAAPKPEAEGASPEPSSEPETERGEG